MAAAEENPEGSKRERLMAFAKRYSVLPVSIRTGDLPKRAASAVVMLAVAGLALWIGGIVLDALFVVVAAICFGELARLVWRATRSPIWRIIGFAFGVIYIGAAAFLLTQIADPAMLMLIFGAVICVDTFAYFFGRAIGGPKIAPSISPSKTWAGLLGGAIGASTALFVFSITYNYVSLGVAAQPPAGLWLIPMGAAIAVVAQAGDFFESWLKRKAGMKDSSNLIPGHGGVFDRIDGLIPVVLLLGIVVFIIDPDVLQS